MGFAYHQLDDPDVREAMLSLWSSENETLRAGGGRSECYGADLLDEGWAQWEEAMPEALASRDDDWLALQMHDPSFWRSHRPRRLKSGGYTRQRVNLEWACNLLCLGEFNIAYVRGLATALQARGETECVVYRAGDAAEPRCECTAWEEQKFSLKDVIAGHRARYWPPDTANETAFSVPSGFNCHHSIRAISN